MTVAPVPAALGIGLLIERPVFWLVLFAWAGLGAALGPTSILALYGRRATRAGVRDVAAPTPASREAAPAHADE